MGKHSSLKWGRTDRQIQGNINSYWKKCKRKEKETFLCVGTTLARVHCWLWSVCFFLAARLLFIWCRFQGLNKRWALIHLLLSTSDERIHFCVFIGLFVGICDTDIQCAATSIWAFISFPAHERSLLNSCLWYNHRFQSGACSWFGSITSITLARTKWKEIRLLS